MRGFLLQKMKTGTFTLDDSGNPDAITLQADCTTCVIRQQGDQTAPWLLYMPAITDTPIKKQAGEGHVFHARQNSRFAKGRIIAYAATVSGFGTITMDMDCEG